MKAVVGGRLGYLMGVPVGSYSLDLGRAHTDFIETKLQRWALPHLESGLVGMLQGSVA